MHLSASVWGVCCKIDGEFCRCDFMCLSRSSLGALCPPSFGGPPTKPPVAFSNVFRTTFQTTAATVCRQSRSSVACYCFHLFLPEPRCQARHYTADSFPLDFALSRAQGSAREAATPAQQKRSQGGIYAVIWGRSLFCWSFRAVRDWRF